MLDQEQVKKDLNINPRKLSQEMIEHPSMFVSYAIQAKEANEKMLQSKMAVELAEGRVDKDIRDEALEDKVKLTEAVITKRILMNSLVLKAKKAHNDAKANYELYKDIKDAFSQRRDMLIQIGSDMRNERKSNLSFTSNDDGNAESNEDGRTMNEKRMALLKKSA